MNRAHFAQLALASLVGYDALVQTAGAAPADVRWAGTVHDPAALRSDLLFFWKTMLEVGPDPFRTSVRADVEALLRDVLTHTNRPMTTSEFTFIAAPVFAALHDGHVQIGPSDEAVPTISFPLIPRVWNKKLIVERSRIVPAGSEVLDVEGIASSRIVDWALSIVGAQTTALQENLASAVMYFVLATHVKHGLYQQYRITWRTPKGEILTKGLQSDRNHHDALRSIPYTFETHDHNRVGVIKYNVCRDSAAFSTFLDASFDRMRSAGAHTLVIDLRANLGGDSAVSDVLLSRFAKVPFRQYGGTSVRSSALLKAHYGRATYTERYTEAAWHAPEGRVISTVSSDADLVHPDHSSSRFDGNVYMLIGPGTFSSGMSCAAATKAYGLATLVGEETGEPMNSTGEVFYVQAPRTGMTGTFTTKLFLAPKPSPDGRGVVPDVVIPRTVHDYATDRDPQLSWILQRVNTA